MVSVTPWPHFTPGERTPGTHCTGGWVGPRAGLDTEARGKILCLCRGSNLDRPVVEPVARHYTAWATRLTRVLLKGDPFANQLLIQMPDIRVTWAHLHACRHEPSTCSPVCISCYVSATDVWWKIRYCVTHKGKLELFKNLDDFTSTVVTEENKPG
jgi:hypothetical protein